jgi:hypothetical protein
VIITSTPGLDYDREAISNDICLVYVDPAFDIDGGFIAGLDIDEGEHCDVGSECSISGWGALHVRNLLRNCFQ